MKILSRYVLREFCVPLFYCTTGFFSIYLLFELFGSFSKLMAAKPGWGKTFAYLVGYLAPYIMWMMPACLMLATLYTMWNFCRHSELIAMRASGIGFLTIVKPILAVAILTAGLVGFVNECYVPRYGQWAKQFKKDHFGKESDADAGRKKRSRAKEGERDFDIGLLSAKPDKGNESAHSDANVKGASGSDNRIDFRYTEGQRLWRVGHVVDEQATTFEDVVVYASYPDSESWTNSPFRGVGKIVIQAPRVQYLDCDWCFQDPKVSYFSQSGERMLSPVPDLDKLTFRTFPEFNEKPRDFLQQSRDWAFSSTKERLEYMETGGRSMSESDRRGHVYDIWFQLLSPLACIVITLFAIPAGIATGRQSVFRGILGALGMFFAFYALTVLCMVSAKTWTWCPPILAAVLPHVVFFFFGCWMFRRHR